MKERLFKPFSSHGMGVFSKDEISKCGSNVIFEENTRIFHPENIEIGSNVYIGHYTILKGYHKNKLLIGDNCWIGQLCFFHSAGGIHIGNGVGIGPCVKILTSQHSAEMVEVPIICSDLVFGEVTIGDNCDIGTGSIILPGVTIGKGSIIGAGAVVTRDVPEYSVCAGNPARLLRKRT
ncbi:acyltransferase [Methanospirillum purgamenti]|nr:MULTISPECIES: acyltransferase [Methanospirillum]MDX8548932.1 acyltransferase [Methanospirillum hungatei]